jgi:integrase/recombinase XerC
MSDITASTSHALDQAQVFSSERGVSIEALITAWLHEKDPVLQSPKTRKAYQSTINDFRSLLIDNGYDLIWQGDDFMPTIADFAQAFAAMRSAQSRHKGPITPATQGQRLAILSSFYLYAAKRRHIHTGNPIDAVDRPHIEPYEQAHPIEHQEVARRLSMIDPSTEQGARDLAILAISLSTGRRVSEIAGLTKGHLTFSGEQIKVTFPKNKGSMMKDTLTPEVSAILAHWLKKFYGEHFADLPDETPIWVNVHHDSKRGQPLRYHGFTGVCNHYLGTSRFHVTRHTFAILMEVAGAKLTDIQQRLGHKNAATTGIYMNKLTLDRNVHADKLTELLGLAGRDLD